MKRAHIDRANGNFGSYLLRSVLGGGFSEANTEVKERGLRHSGFLNCGLRDRVARACILYLEAYGILRAKGGRGGR